MNIPPQPFFFKKGAQDTSRPGQDLFRHGVLNEPRQHRCGDRKTMRVCPNSLESVSCRFSFFRGQVFWALLWYLFEHLSSSVAPITPLGTATKTHLQSNGPIFSTHRTGKDQNKDENRETSTRRKIRQTTRCSRHKHVTIPVGHLLR